MVETTIEKKLNNDILQKNTLRNEIEGYVRTVSQWRDKLVNLKNFQGQTKYADSIKRYVTRIEGLRVEFNQMNEEVEKNIRETGKFADADVKAFSSQLEQEASKYIGETEKNVPKKKFKIKINPAQAKKKTKAKSKGTGKGVGSLEQKVEKAIGRVSEGLEEAERIAGKMIILNRNLKKVDGSASEDSYTQELKRIAREKAIYS
ncbi:MAG: hypothetical protein HON76_04580 [Candidatus Scalindua sp.]|jgi:hypothetical protein|nr:hypothetical protein [Candidatus Scalindua sp.]MBT5306831.1 hypothetical protein [Candidatus Scalindua sp.]MBT6226287.1 hypothetical protein [Candidatus Scalindua sp.]MBT6561787.1 hypothetical protein [Candidatus Scalindua sp.]MBT7212765.1 hypothetical protein [Candidatus Scalindua sp.]